MSVSNKVNYRCYKIYRPKLKRLNEIFRNKSNNYYYSIQDTCINAKENW